MLLFKKAINYFIRKFEISTIPNSQNIVYLTFDDGPEPGITEFVLNQLDTYGYKATFFCRGDNAIKYPNLLKQIQDKGHIVANHTYSHLHAYTTPLSRYVEDVNRANKILNTIYFRPPHGSLTFRSWFLLKSKFKCFFWSLNSGDSDLERFDREACIANLKNNTHSGEIVLFHFCNRHSNETRVLLPIYLEWLNGMGYKSQGVDVK